MSKTVVMTYKIPIIKPLTTDWKTFGKVSGKLTTNLIKIMNDAISMNYIHIQDKFRYEKKHNKKYIVREHYGVGGYQTVISRELKERYRKLKIPGDLLGQAVRQSLDTFSTVSKDVLSGKAALPTFRRDQPIPVRGRSLKLSENYTVRLPFMTKETADELGFKGRNKQNFEVQLSTRGNAKVILDRILKKEYEICDSKIQRDKKGKWFLLLSYKQPVKEKKLDKDTIVGIDLGISKAAYMALNNSKKNFFIDGGEVASFRRRVRGRRKSLQNQLRVCSDNRRGRGRKTLLKPLDKLSEKESNFRGTINHRYSKRIVEWAVQNNAGVIQVEDLTGINKLNSFLANWDYFDLQEKIRYKAEREGIEFRRIKPNYTSQRCNECGHINRENRESQEVFECVSCSHKTNADLNAARNIATKDIEEIIKDAKKEQKEKDDA